MPRLYTEVQQGTIQFFCGFFFFFKHEASAYRDKGFLHTRFNRSQTSKSHQHNNRAYWTSVLLFKAVPNASGETNKEECKLLHAYCSGRSDL